MKKKLLTLFCFISVLGFGQTIQNSFKIINNEHPEKEAFYTKSIEKASMENYRLKDKEVTLHFENGFDCVMLSAKELFMNGRNINAASYEDNFPKKFILPIFNMLESGQLKAIYASGRKKQTK